MLFAFSGESLARTNKKGFGLFVLVSSKASVQCVPVWQILTSHSHVVCQLDGGGGADLAGVLPAVHLLGQADHQLTPVVGLLHFASEEKNGGERRADADRSRSANDLSTNWDIYW